MFRIGNNKVPENQQPVLFGKNIDEKTQCKNLNKSSRKGRAEKSCKLPCNKSLKGKTLTNTDRKTSSHKEGPDLSDAEVIWRKLARCESRIELMGKMMKKGVGFNEVESYANKIEQKVQTRGPEKRTRNVVKMTMSIKLIDEKRRHAGLLKQKIELRKSLFQICEENKNRMGKIMRKLRKAAKEEKGKCRKKGEKKLNHIIEKRKKVETGNDEKIKVPEEIVELDEAKAFNRIEFDKIVVKEKEPEVI